MPQIFRFLNLIFFFATRGEHLPIHVHVSDNDGNQTIFDLIIVDGVLTDIKTRKKAGFDHISKKNQGLAKAFIYAYYAQIATKWFQHFVLNQKVKIETVNKLDNIVVNTDEIASQISELNKHFYPTEKKQPAKTKSTKK